MSGFNPNIELSVEDMELIEDALRYAKQVLAKAGAAGHDLPPTIRTVREIDDLLGHLHNQKVFFRPRGAPYVSG